MKYFFPFMGESGPLQRARDEPAQHKSEALRIAAAVIDKGL